MQSTTRLRLRDTLRVIKNETKHLASALQDGEGYEETLPAAKRIDQLLAQAAEDGRRLMLPDTVMDEVTRTGDLVNRLRPYYGGWEPPHA